jgi:Outer membrane protein beta-barrel domain
LNPRIRLLLILCGMVGSAFGQGGQASFGRFNFNAGGGIGIGRGDVASFVGNAPAAIVGAGYNVSRMFGLNAEYMYNDLKFRDSVIVNQSLPGQSGHMQSVSLNGIVNVPKHFGKFAAYGIFGVGFYDRTVSLSPSQPLQDHATYQPAWKWWDLKRDIFGNPLAGQTLSSNSKVAGGFNFGGGITFRTNYLGRAKLFAELRYHRAYQSDGKAIVMPLTVGLRW